MRIVKFLFGRELAQIFFGAMVLSGLIFCAITVISLMSPAIEEKINVTNIALEKNNAYIVHLNPLNSHIFEVIGASVGQSATGSLVLLEDGYPLGPGDTHHDLIRTHGGGVYSYWHKSLYFSTSDNSDPRINGRIYSYRAQAALSKTLRFIRDFAAIIVTITLFGWVISSIRSFSLDSFVIRWGKAFGVIIASIIDWFSRFNTLNRSWQLVIVVLYGIVGVVIVLMLWRSGSTSHLGVASLIPVSDALWFYRCAISGAEGPASFMINAADGVLSNVGSWCSRRAIWPIALISIFFIANWHAALVLLILAFLAAASVGVLFVSVWRIYGTITAFFVASFSLLFAIEWVFGTFMTENWGFIAGLTGAALLIEYSRHSRILLLVLGLSIFSVAITARAGALFTIPLLLLWACITLFKLGHRWRSLVWFLPIAALLVGPGLQLASAYYFTGSISNTGGNFSVVLYGLSTGSRDWSEAYRHYLTIFSKYPESEVFRIIYQHSISNILDKPQVFFKSLIDAGISFTYSLFPISHSKKFLPFLYILFGIGLAYCLGRIRESAYLLPVIVFLGELLSAPLIFDSGGQRVFASTFWVRPLLVGIGIMAIFRLVLYLLQYPSAVALRQNLKTMQHNIPVFFLAYVILFFSTVPLIVKSGSLSASMPSDPHACQPNEISAVVRIGRESMAISLTESIMDRRAIPISGPLVVLLDQLSFDKKFVGSWWSNKIGELKNGSTIIMGFDVRFPTKAIPLILFSDNPLEYSPSGVYKICAGEKTNRIFGDDAIRKLNKIEPIDQSSH